MIKRYPTTFRFILAAILLALSVILPDFIGKYVKIPQIGIILMLIATWILYRTDNKSLHAIGINLQIRNVSLLFLGLFVGIAAFAFSTWCRTLYTGENWHINPEVNWTLLFEGLVLVLPTVVTQQLLFRGYPFTKTIEKSNFLIANVIWGTIFVCYHDIFGNLVYLPFMALSLYLAHYMFASALLKSATLYLPIGIHWGHNWSSGYFNSYAPAEKGIFYLTDQQVFTSFSSTLIFWLSYNIGFIILAIVFWRWKRVKSHKHQAESGMTFSAV